MVMVSDKNGTGTKGINGKVGKNGTFSILGWGFGGVVRGGDFEFVFVALEFGGGVFDSRVWGTSLGKFTISVPFSSKIIVGFKKQSLLTHS